MTASLPPIASCCLAAVFLTCSAAQMLHGYLRIMHSAPGRRSLVAAYEVAVLVHAVVMAACAIPSLNPFAVAGSATAVPLFADEPSALLWANAAVAAAIAGVALAGLQSAGEPRRVSWMFPVEVVLAFACTPPALVLSGGWHVLMVAVDALYLAFRTVFLIVLDRGNRYKIVSPLAVVEALKRLPEGIMYVDEQGILIDANAAMRRILGTLGLSPDSVTVHDLREAIAVCAQAGPSADAAGDGPAEENDRNVAAGPGGTPAEGEGGRARPAHSRRSSAQLPEDATVAHPAAVWQAGEPEAWTIVRLDGGEARLFAFDGLDDESRRRYPAARPMGAQQQAAAVGIFGVAPHARVIAYDVTEEMQLIDEIGRTNAQLQASQRELRASAEAMRVAAENEAMLKMRGRVHDVIGQRLSLLHRALEDNALTDDKLEQLKPLLNGILDDLSADVRVSPADDLVATVDAFALSGVNVEIEGQLPADEARARLFADCVREAATNAVKHARARQVRVTLGQAELSVSNDGAPPAWPITEGTGLAHMRHAVESAGGRLDITPNPFTIHVRA